MREAKLRRVICLLFAGLFLFILIAAVPMPSPIDNIKKQLESDSQAKISAMYELVKLTNKEVLPLIVAKLDDTNEDVRLHACFLLGTLKKVEVKDRLVKVALHDSSPKVAIHAAEALYALGFTSGLKVITTYAKSTNLPLALLALDKLEVIADISTAEALKKILITTTEPSVKSRVEKIIRIINGEIKKQDITKARDIAAQANAELNADNSAKAKILINQALEVDRLNAYAHYLLGMIYAKTKETYDLAITEFKKALEYGHVDQGELYFVLGTVYLNKSANEEALSALKNALKYENSARVNYQLAVIYSNMGKIDEAILLCNKALELNNNFKYAHYSLNKLYETKGDKTKANYHLEKYLSLSKQSDTQKPK